MTTTLRDLIDRLEDLAGDIGDEHEVRVAYQPTYPLTGSILGASVVVSEEGPVDRPVVWLAVGDAEAGVSPYAPAAAFDNGW